MTRQHINPHRPFVFALAHIAMFACMIAALPLPRAVATSLEQALALSMLCMALGSVCAVVIEHLRDGWVDLAGNPVVMTVGFLLLSIFSTPLVHMSVTEPEAYAIYQTVSPDE